MEEMIGSRGFSGGNDRIEGVVQGGRTRARTDGKNGWPRHFMDGIMGLLVAFSTGFHPGSSSETLQSTPRKAVMMMVDDDGTTVMMLRKGFLGGNGVEQRRTFSSRT